MFMREICAIKCTIYGSGLQPFLFNRPPTGTLLKNHPPHMILVLSKIISYLKNNSMLMKYEREICLHKKEQTKQMHL